MVRPNFSVVLVETTTGPRTERLRAFSYDHHVDSGKGWVMLKDPPARRGRGGWQR
jgi:hypothetical protein